MTEKAKKWSEQTVATLRATVGTDTPVSVEKVQEAAKVLGVTDRSIASKLRQLDIEVASMAKESTPTFSPDESNDLKNFVTSNAGNYTYKEIAANFANAKFTAKQVQGKLLALELTGSVKPAEKVEAARVYTEAEEVKFIEMANAGAFIEDIAAALGKEIASVRGKALSLTRNSVIKAIPAQKVSHAKDHTDPVESLGDKLATMTVEEIATATDKTVRGIKTLLTRRGLNAKNYNGAAKREKAEAKLAANTAVPA